MNSIAYDQKEKDNIIVLQEEQIRQLCKENQALKEQLCQYARKTEDMAAELQTRKQENQELILQKNALAKELVRVTMLFQESLQREFAGNGSEKLRDLIGSNGTLYDFSKLSEYIDEDTLHSLLHEAGINGAAGNEGGKGKETKIIEAGEKTNGETTPSADEDEKNSGEKNRTDGDGKNGQHKGPGEKDKTGGKKKSLENLKRADSRLLQLFQNGCSADIRYVIDDIFFTKEELEERFGEEDLRHISISSDIELYYSVEAVVPRLVPTVHICVKMRSGDTTCRNPHFGKPFAGSVCGATLLAFLLTQKYVMHTPWFRLEKQAWLGNLVSRGEMINWAELGVNKYFLPVWHVLLDRLLSEFSVIQIDETYETLRHLLGKSGSFSGYYWGLRSTELDRSKPGIVLYFFDPSRAAFVPQYLLDGFKGMILSDGYAAYTTLKKRNGEIILCACWTHGRRPVLKALQGTDLTELLGKVSSEGEETLINEWLEKNLDEDNPEKLINDAGAIAKELNPADKASFFAWICLCLISRLFHIEREIKDYTPEQRAAYRQGHSRPFVESLFSCIDRLDAMRDGIGNEHLLEGIDYFLNRRENLQRFLEDGNIPLDNSATERAMMQLALGRNAWVCHDNEDGALTTAVMYSLVQTCKECGADPYLYFCYLLEKMPGVLRQHEAELDARMDYEARKKKRLEECRERWTKSKHRGDPKLDLSDLGDKTSLEFLDPFLPFSHEFTAYCEQKKRQGSEVPGSFYTAENLKGSGISKEILERIMNTQSASLGAVNGRAFLDLFRQQYMENQWDCLVPGGDDPRFEGSPVRGAVVPSSAATGSQEGQASVIAQEEPAADPSLCSAEQPSVPDSGEEGNGTTDPAKEETVGKENVENTFDEGLVSAPVPGGKGRTGGIPAGILFPGTEIYPYGAADPMGQSVTQGHPDSVPLSACPPFNRTIPIAGNGAASLHVNAHDSLHEPGQEHTRVPPGQPAREWKTQRCRTGCC